MDYIHSEHFMLDTMLHREGNHYVYMESIPNDESKETMWLNGFLLNCKHVVKHIGNSFQIADLIAKKLGIKKIDEEATKQRDDGDVIFTSEFSELHYIICDLPIVIEANTELKPRTVKQNSMEMYSEDLDNRG